MNKKLFGHATCAIRGGCSHPHGAPVVAASPQPPLELLLVPGGQPPIGTIIFTVMMF